MATTIKQQVALDEALVPSTQRCPFFKAFLVTVDVPEIYMQEFWATAYVHQHSIRFKMNNNKHIKELESFREMLHICPRIPGQAFDELPFEEEILEFIRFLGHGLQVKQKDDGIFISQDKYVAEILRKFNFIDIKSASTPVDTQKPLLKDLDSDDFDVHLYRSMIGSLMYLTSSRPDIMFVVCTCARFQCKKQTVVATSTTEAEYVAAASCCGQVIFKRGRDIMIPQSDGPPKKVVDEAVHKELGDIMERAATTASSLEAEQDNVVLSAKGDVEAQTKFEAASTQFNDPPLSRVHTLRCGEDNIQLKELMVFCTKMSDCVYQKQTEWKDGQLKTITKASLRRHLKLEDNGGITSLPNTEIFEQLALMRHVTNSDKLTFQKGHFSPQWRMIGYVEVIKMVRM
nr:hypothetical protein [Tanacetum cinerariifolium]